MNRLKSATALGGLVIAAATAWPAFAQDQALIDAAKAEGTVTTIALPHDWCNYGGVDQRLVLRPGGQRHCADEQQACDRGGGFQMQHGSPLFMRARPALGTMRGCYRQNSTFPQQKRVQSRNWCRHYLAVSANS